MIVLNNIAEEIGWTGFVFARWGANDSLHLG
jgi:hypothetical protein